MVLDILDFATCTQKDTLESWKAWLENDLHMTNEQSD